MNTVRLHARLQFDELIRVPAFSVPSIALPLLTYLIFGLPGIGDDPQQAAAVLLAFAAFATLGIVMFQFGVGIAADRASPWERYLRTLPASASARFTARLWVSLCFTALALVPLVTLAVAVTPVHLDGAAWARCAVALVAGSVPLGLLGIMLGYLLDERGALPVTNLVYLPLSYAGGLFGARPEQLPSVARHISPWLPTRQWSDILLDIGLAGHVPVHQVLALGGYGLGFGVLAVLGYRRDEYRQWR